MPMGLWVSGFTSLLHPGLKYERKCLFLTGFGDHLGNNNIGKYRMLKDIFYVQFKSVNFVLKVNNSL